MDFQRFNKHHTLQMVNHAPSSMSDNESELTNRCQRSLDDGTEKDPMEKLRILCLARGPTGIIDLGRALRIMDTDDNQQLSNSEFIKSLKDSEMFKEADKLFKEFDAGGSGTVNVDDFLLRLRPPMSQSRISIVNKAFHKLDKRGDGVVTIDDLRDVYSVRHDPQYTSGELTKGQILNTFLAHFEVGGPADGRITYEEFMNYYAAVSASVENDTYFDLMIRQDYNL